MKLIFHEPIGLFEKLPVSPGEDCIRWLQTADTHLGRQVWLDFPAWGDPAWGLKQIGSLATMPFKSPRVAAVVVAGDIFDASIADSYTADLFAKFVEFNRRANVSTYGVSGQHDASDPSWHSALGAQHVNDGGFVELPLYGLDFHSR